jgi:hypothetical protein
MKIFLKLFLFFLLIGNNGKILGNENLTLENYKIQIKNENFKLFYVEMRLQNSTALNIKLKVAIDNKKNNRSWFKILTNDFSKNQ